MPLNSSAAIPAQPTKLKFDAYEKNYTLTNDTALSEILRKTSNTSGILSSNDWQIEVIHDYPPTGTYPKGHNEYTIKGASEFFLSDHPITAREANIKIEQLLLSRKLSTDLNGKGFQYIGSVDTTPNLKNQKFENTKFFETLFINTNFEGATFENVIFQDVICLNANFSNAKFKNINFRIAKFKLTPQTLNRFYAALRSLDTIDLTYAPLRKWVIDQIQEQANHAGIFGLEQAAKNFEFQKGTTAIEDIVKTKLSPYPGLPIAKIGANCFTAESIEKKEEIIARLMLSHEGHRDLYIENGMLRQIHKDELNIGMEHHGSRSLEGYFGTEPNGKFLYYCAPNMDALKSSLDATRYALQEKISLYNPTHTYPDQNMVFDTVEGGITLEKKQHTTKQHLHHQF